ncbi:MAG: 4-(cytidine 5'-diphospho)-2-C-methyl-D-erythritol kinase, partial [Muribaculaceae bacterium]|nr:4-(cytidine 5'-diphospho)-2-C-methyl-D-erythritol kinase [Muribaculaceae bacterium]
MDKNIMMTFVNAKINIGLQIVRRREDGYHDLQTVFYPVGKYAGTPSNPEPFCDMLEVTPSSEEGMRFLFTGNRMKCEEKDNLVCRAARLFMKHTGDRLLRQESGRGIEVRLDKHIPDGAGMGGGSADASFVLRALNSMLPEDDRLNDDSLATLALGLGADCPFFIYNRPMYGAGVGEKLTDIRLDLSGYWLLVVKPDVYVSTRDAFAGVVPRPGNIDLRSLPGIPVTEWQGLV